MINNQVKTDFKKCLFSINTIVLIVAVLILTAINCWVSYSTKVEIIGQLSSGAEDLNITALMEWIEIYNGFEFFFSFYNYSDEFTLSIFAILVWMGIFVIGEFGKYRENGYGNLLVVRFKYKSFFKNYIVSRSLYIASLLGIITLLQLVIAFFLGGADTLVYAIGDYTYNLLSCIVIIFLQYILITFYYISIFVIAISLSVLVKNKYVLTTLPIIVFGIVPLLVFSTIANVFNWSSFFAYLCVPFWYMAKVITIIGRLDIKDVTSVVLSVVLFALMSRIMFVVNIKKMEGNYL